eukprot:6336914-Amphidinium_carterae.1
MAPSGSSLPYGSDSSGVHCDHGGVAGSCKPSSTKHNRSGNDLSTGGDKSTDALETSPKECSTWRDRQVPSQARGLSAPGGVCSGLSSRILVDVQDMPSTLAPEPTRVSCKRSTLAEEEVTALMCVAGESDDAQDDFECAFARAHMSLHTRFESHEQLQMLVQSQCVGRVLGFDCMGKAHEVWMTTGTDLPSVVRGCAFKDCSDVLSEQYDVEYVVETMTTEQVWQCATDGVYCMCALRLGSGNVYRVHVHEPSNTFPGEIVKGSATAWRVQLGFDH